MKCRYCYKEKLITQFPIASTVGNKVYRRRKCKECYRVDKLRRRQSIRTWFTEFKKTLKCEKCGDNRFYVLVFHHRKPSDKKTNLGDTLRLGWGKTRIMKEVVKCDVLCSNCHKEKHYIESLSKAQVG